MPRLALSLLAATAVILACGHSGAAVRRPPGEGEPRPFEMGVSSVPPAPTDEAYRSAFAFAGTAGEVILVQRAPPWSDFLPGASISERTERLTRLEREVARENGLKLFLAIDPTDPSDRGRLAGLPADLQGRDFSDGRVRTAFIAYAKYLAVNYKPAYMALGVEVDMYFNRRGDGPFRNFQSLYFEAYDAVKQASPSTLVFPTFQFEDLQGKVRIEDTTPQPTWSLIGRFDPKIDMLAVSSFPGFIFRSTASLPDGYYEQLRGKLAKPLALVSIGWRSAPTADEAFAGEVEQADFLRGTLLEAESLGASLVIWYLGKDLLSPPGSAFDPLAATGLFRPNGQPKAAWRTWQTWLKRPAPK